MMLREIYLVLTIACCAMISNANFLWSPKSRENDDLRCWSCENEDLRGCKTKGQIEICRKGVQQSCQTEIRYHGNRGIPIIKTGCKEGKACTSNKMQNRGAAWAPTQCNTQRMNSVCRCCCVGSMCNRGNRNLLCKFPSTPVRPVSPVRDVPLGELRVPIEKACSQPPEAPENGAKECFGDTGLRSFCKFTCNKGFRLVGYDTTICVDKGRQYIWNRAPPKCEKQDICENTPGFPKNGINICNGEGDVGTQCFYICDHGYVLNGPSSIICEKSSTSPSGADWNDKPPTCKKITCDPMPAFPINGDVECSGIGELGTICEFTCDAGYDLIGPTQTTCLRFRSMDKGSWSHETPICKQVRCTFVPRAPLNGQKECNGDGELGTVCSYACDDGFRLKGFPATTCHRNSVAQKPKWTRMVPKCEPICETMAVEPENGFSICKGEGQVGTTCRFQCRPGFEIENDAITTCLKGEYGTDWSHPSPTCKPVCKPLPEAPDYGHQRCIGDGDVGTVCEYSCNDGFKLVGEGEQSCTLTEEGANWTAPSPTCKPFCERLPPLIGGFSSCEGNEFIGAKCSFTCDSGRRLLGASETSCVFESDRAMWTNEIPVCEYYCGPPPTSLENGIVECSGTGEIGSSCSFACEGEAYEMVGESLISCVLEDGNARWTHKEPRCNLRPTCPHIGELKHGEVSCDSDLNVDGTICTFSCSKPGYSLVPNTRATAVCHRNQTWSKRPCCVDCKKIRKDIIIAMDSSGSITALQWITMQSFVKNLLRGLRFGSDGTKVSVFQFSSGQRSEGFMYFDAYPKNKLIKNIDEMKRMATGTKTGLALEYAHHRFIKDENNRKDVPDMLIVITDGEADDMDRVETESKKLRDDGVEILALAIKPNKNFVQQMIKMTGKETNVMMAKNMDALTDDVVNLLLSKTCQDERECERIQ